MLQFPCHHLIGIVLHSVVGVDCEYTVVSIYTTVYTDIVLQVYSALGRTHGILEMLQNMDAE